MVLLPAAIVAPVSLLLGGLVLTLLPATSVAVPAGVALVDGDALDGLVVEVAADPASRWAAGEVDAAVVDAALHEGPELWFEVRGLWRTDAQREALEDGLRASLHAERLRRVVAAGGSVADLDRVDVDVPPTGLGRRLWFAFVLLGLMAPWLLLAARTAEDRARGVFESFAVTGTPTAVLLTARAAVGGLLGATAAGVFFAPLVMMLPEEIGVRVEPAIAVEAALVILLGAVAFVHVGLVSESNRSALTLGSVVLLGLGAVLRVGDLLGVAQVPLLGLAQEGGAAVVAGRVAGTAALVGLAVAALWRAAAPHRLLPAGGGGE